MFQTEQTWLAADYHLPFTYSCRSPVSSPYSGRALPTPGPVTIKLALIHTAVELFGVSTTEAELFSPIMAMTALVKPPASVVISTHRLQGYKANDSGYVGQSLLYREFACAEGCMTIFLHIPTPLSNVFEQLIRAIGYWGQANSFTACVAVQQRVPEMGSYAQPLDQLTHLRSVKNFFSTFVSEFCVSKTKWSDLVNASNQTMPDIIAPRLYIWPLVAGEQRSGHRLFLYHSLD